MKYLFFIIIFFASCSSETDGIYGIDMFKGTEVWKLAKAVDREDTNAIKRLAAKCNINYREPNWGWTVLEWAVVHDERKSVYTLVACGANPNIQNNIGRSAFICAAINIDSSDVLKFMLAHGGDLATVANDSFTSNVTPLMAAASCRLESVKLLVAAGADINYLSPQHFNAIINAAISERIDIVKYLIIDCKANFKSPPDVQEQILYFFRMMPFPLDSEDYKMKMEVVNYMKKYGVDYWKEPIPDYFSKNYTKDYLDKY